MTAPNLSEVLASDRRLVILRSLSDQSYSLNDSVLQTVLEQFGHRVTRDQVRGDISWLEEQGLVTVETVGGYVMVATLTERGGEVATGRARHPGVKRPSARGASR